jgi:hypothetical protein
MSKPNYKIEKLVASCNDCGHCTIASSVRNKEEYFAICTFDKPIMLLSNSVHPKHYKLEIPEDCPLDNFEGNLNKYIEEDAN